MIEARLDRLPSCFIESTTYFGVLLCTILMACGPQSSATSSDTVASVDIFYVLGNKGAATDAGQIIFTCSNNQECDDFDPCTNDQCDIASGTCLNINDPSNEECSQTCFLASDCDDGDPCTEDQCVDQTCANTQKTSCLATSCSTDDDCDGSVCVDGYCCSSYCDGPCMACNLEGWEGTCTPVTNASDPDSCPAPDTCDANSVCASDKCGEITCPDLTGYKAKCNAQDTCEYEPLSSSETWHEYDVWIYVPPGDYQMGGPESEGGGVEERPVHQVSILDGFFIAKYEVTVMAYEACKSASQCTPTATHRFDAAGWGVNRSDKGREHHPQNGMTKPQTEAFCAWFAEDGRLPTEAEWEYAAKGAEAHRTYPWGNAPEPSCSTSLLNFNPMGFELNGYGCETGGTSPVGSYPDGASPWGVMDMAGNVWEWVQDCLHSTYDGAPVDGSPWVEDCVDNSRFIQRGGGFVNPDIQQRTAARVSSTPNATRAQVGGRCVRPLP